MDGITVPIGPGKGHVKTTQEAIYSIIQAMRGHVRDLRDSGEIDQFDLLNQYLSALELVWHQNQPSPISGVGLPDDLIGRAQKYHLAFPGDNGKKSPIFLDYFND